VLLTTTRIYSETYSIRQVVGKKVTTNTMKVTRKNSGYSISVTIPSQGNYSAETDMEYNCLSMAYTLKNLDYEITISDSLIISNRNNNKISIVKIKQPELPFYQAWSLGLAQMHQPSVNTLSFYSIRLKKPNKLFRFNAVKVKEFEKLVHGVPTRCVEIKVTVDGIAEKFFKNIYIIRKSDGRLISSFSPAAYGKPLITTELLSVIP
jgi:hypothetical protein